MLKPILNKYEEVTYYKIKEVCNDVGTLAFTKIRLADIFNINNSGISNEEFSFALKSHFDFIICDKETTYPLFAVEFDGISHRNNIQKHRDNIKNKLSIHFNLPLLRINNKYLEEKYRELDLLTWCMQVWFLADSFFLAQQSGYIPYDEPFDPYSIISISNNDKQFPFYLTYEIRRKINNLYKQQKIQSRIPNLWIGTNDNKNYYGISWIYINDKNAIYSVSGMRAQNFPVSQSDLLAEILIFDLYNELKKYLNKQNNDIKMMELNKVLHYYEQKYKLALFTEQQ